jgi:hypothetical protein
MPTKKAWEEWKVRETARRAEAEEDKEPVEDLVIRLRRRIAELDAQIAFLEKHHRELA